MKRSGGESIMNKRQRSVWLPASLNSCRSVQLRLTVSTLRRWEQLVDSKLSQVTYWKPGLGCGLELSRQQTPPVCVCLLLLFCYEASTYYLYGWYRCCPKSLLQTSSHSCIQSLESDWYFIPRRPHSGDRLLYIHLQVTLTQPVFWTETYFGRPACGNTNITCRFLHSFNIQTK